MNKVSLSSHAVKDLDKINEYDFKKIERTIKMIKNSEDLNDLKSQKLKGIIKDVYSYRISRTMRMLYSKEGDEVTILGFFDLNDDKFYLRFVENLP